jgi:hypothetical protein
MRNEEYIEMKIYIERGFPSPPSEVLNGATYARQFLVEMGVLHTFAQ